MSHPELFKRASNGFPQGDYRLFLWVMMEKIGNFFHHHPQKQAKRDFFSWREKSEMTHKTQKKIALLRENFGITHSTFDEKGNRREVQTIFIDVK